MKQHTGRDAAHRRKQKRQEHIKHASRLLLIVISVVEQGQCMTENRIKDTAVIHVQPFAESVPARDDRLPISESVPLDR